MKNKKSKALLILIGGRPMPNFLTAQYLKPDLIVPIASKEEIVEGKWEKLKPNFEPLCKKLSEVKEVDAFDLREIKSKCYEAIDENPDVEWVFNITCATTVMSIAAYEVAKEKNLDCWYLNTNTRQVLALNGKPPESDLYNATIEDYLKFYSRTISKQGKKEIPNELINLVETFANDLNFANKIQQSYQQAKRTGQPDQIVITSEDEETKNVWKKLEEIGLVKERTENANGKLFLTIDKESGVFVNGGWLEVYLWMTAKNEKCFDDVGYSIVIPGEKDESYELDFALTFAGMLLIGECKTGKKAFEAKNLHKFNNVANHLGSNFVGKIFVTNQIVDEKSVGMKGFLHQASQNHIVVVQGNNLKNLGDILRKESGVETINRMKPTHFRG